MDLTLDLFQKKIECKPFIKWAGGKRQLIPHLIKYLPDKYNQYFEPFLGGGALFFALQPSEAILSDINPELINVYLTIKNNPKLLIEDLKKHLHNKEYFYQLRNIDRKEDFKNWTNIEKASRFIYLNKTCFNGLYRVNSKGHFNVPFGSYKNPKIIDEVNIYNCSKSLQNVKVIAQNFNKISDYISEKDFVYFDPPYVPITKSSSFTKYYKDDFDINKQKQLKTICDFVNSQKAHFMLSNSYTKIIIDLYKNYNINIVNAKRVINSKGDKRGEIKEVIITNY